MIPGSTPEEVRSRLLDPQVVAEPAVYLASDASGHLSGQRIVATEWSPEDPDGRPAYKGLGL